ncbi:MAG: UTRA domain-containing protein [Rhizomicrobium sp.]
MSSKGGTLHDRIRGNIEKRILSGAWRAGSSHPVRARVDGAIRLRTDDGQQGHRQPREAGLVVRRRKVGSFVAQPRVHSAVLDIPDIQADITARGDDYSLRLLSRKERRAHVGVTQERLLECQMILALRCLHLASDRPFALEERLINLDAVPDAADIDFAEVAPGTWLLEHVPWTQAEHRITAINVQGEGGIAAWPSTANRLPCTGAADLARY